MIVLSQDDIALKARITKYLKFMNLRKLAIMSKACSAATLVKMRDMPGKTIGLAHYKALEVFFKEQFKDL